MKIFNIIALIAILAAAYSCSDETVLVPNNDLGPSVEAIILDSSKIKKGINEKSLLKYSTEKDKQIFQLNLARIEASLLYLARDKRDKNALTVLYQAVKEIDRLQFLKMDDAVIAPFLTGIYEELERVARYQGQVLEDLQWAIFSHDFSDNIAPFGTMGISKEWEKGWSRDRGYVTVGSYGNQAALLSPAFDLTSIRNPKFRIKHSISINQNTGNSGGAFDRNVILNGVFKAYVSTDYVDGDPMDTTLATWHEVSLAPYPKGIDFHTVYSPEIDLSDFVAENVSIKLEFDMRNTKFFGKHYVSWYVEEFSVLGAGDELAIVDRPKDLYFHEFKKEDFYPFRILNVLAGGATWGPYGFSEGSVDLAKIQSNGVETESWLLSPRIDLADGQNLILNIKEEVRNPVWDKYQILISTNYRGGNPADSTWVSIDRTPAEPAVEGAWVKLTSNIDLSPYAGKAIVVGFKYIAGADPYNVWEIKSIGVRGMGADIKYYPYELTYKPIPDVVTPPPVIDEGGEVFYNHSFGSDALNGFNQVTLEGSAAEWMHTTYNQSAYARISGYKTKQTGTRLLYSQAIDLAEKTDAQVSVVQAINYYSDAAAQALNLIRIVAAVVEGDEFIPADLEWTDLYFEVQMPGNSFNAIDSGWLSLPAKFQKKKVVIGFMYKATSDFYPNWDLHEMKLREGE